MCNVGKIQVLLDAKANIYVLEARGWSVLHLVAKSASRYGTEAIRIFLEAGAETIIDVQDKEGKTALHFAAEANNRAMVQELLNSGANLSIQTKDGKAAIDLTKDADIQRLLSPGRRSISVNSSTPLIPTSA
jgi:ankyrin repeat protein